VSVESLVLSVEVSEPGIHSRPKVGGYKYFIDRIPKVPFLPLHFFFLCFATKKKRNEAKKKENAKD